MNGLGLALVLLAATLHASWNLLAKRGGDPFLFLWSAISVAGLLFAPWGAVVLWRSEPTWAAAPYVLASGVVHAVYFYALGASYRLGDFSRVYPIARGLGVAGVPVLAGVFLGERLTPLGYVGIATVVAGMAVTSFNPGHRGRLGLTRGTAWALGTGVCVAAYSTIDKAGVGALDPLPYVWLLNAVAALLTAPVALGRLDELRREWQRNRWRIIAAAGATLTAYLLVLHAFLVAKVGYVVAAREVSIVLSAIIGAVWLREGNVRWRIGGSLVILTGVACIAVAE
jgi:drug/metabolite transporter (DMT)-like permease